MEQITGRIVKDAQIRKTNSGKELVSFTVAVNDRYKPKDGAEVKETRFFSCAYWLGTNVQKALKQGTLVSVLGRVNLNAYKNSDGEYHANLTFHANYIDILAKVNKETDGVATGAPDTKKDIPF